MSLETKAKELVAKHAINYIEDNMTVGLGTGSTVEHFIVELAKIKHKIDAVVTSSKKTYAKLKEYNIPVVDLNSVKVNIYIDSADEINPLKELIKGGGGAHTNEKILSASSEKFICIAQKEKFVQVFKHPIALEVISMARGLVGREILKMGGNPVYRKDFITDNGNIIIDAHGLSVVDTGQLEFELNNIPGVVSCGLFTKQKPDVVLLASGEGIEIID